MRYAVKVQLRAKRAQCLICQKARTNQLRKATFRFGRKPGLELFSVGMKEAKSNSRWRVKLQVDD